MSAAKDPLRAGALVTEFGVLLDQLHVGRLRHEQLVAANGDRTPPLSTQLVWQLLHTLPEHIAAKPGSGAWREETRRLFGGLPIYVEPTRRETQAALADLAQLEMIPGWVNRAAAR